MKFVMIGMVVHGKRKMDTWYKIAMDQIIEQTWIYNCCTSELCSERFLEFDLKKYIERMNNLFGYDLTKNRKS